MKIVLTGGGTGGHFYPLIAIAEEITALASEYKFAAVKLYYFSDDEYDREVLLEHGIQYRQVPAGKVRLYFSLKNITDMIKTAVGILVATWRLFLVYPDVVMGKGGYASFPTLVAARLLRIPVIIHESDTVPGRVNKTVGKWAEKVAVSYPEAGEYFKKEKVAHTGQPVRSLIATPVKDGAYEYFGLNPELPTVFILGGSQGAKKINDAMLMIAQELTERFQVIHQVGVANKKVAEDVKLSMLEDKTKSSRYQIHGFLSLKAMSHAGGISDVVVTRAGSQLFEISAWGKPAVIIPIQVSNGDHQKKNAYSFARRGGGVVIEEPNLTPTVLYAEIARIIDNKEVQEEMSKGSRQVFKQDAATTIARALLAYGMKHEMNE